MKVLAVYASPRGKNGNSSRMLDEVLKAFPEQAEIVRLYLADLKFTGSCAERPCKVVGYCTVEDDMQQVYRLLQEAEIIIFATGALFSDVSYLLKMFMERTWWMKGMLKNKIGGYVISGRRYIESAINTIHAFMLRHRMILGGSGALGYTFTEMGTIDADPLALRDSYATGQRLVELYNLIYSK